MLDPQGHTLLLLLLDCNHHPRVVFIITHHSSCQKSRITGTINKILSMLYNTICYCLVNTHPMHYLLRTIQIILACILLRFHYNKLSLNKMTFESTNGLFKNQMNKKLNKTKSKQGFVGLFDATQPLTIQFSYSILFRRFFSNPKLKF